MEIHEFMKIVSGENRIKVLEALARGETKEQIRQQIPKSTLFHALKSLRGAELIEEDRDKLRITSKGYACFKLFEKFRDSYLTLKRILEHFSGHVIPFPEEFFIRLHELGDFRVVISESWDLLKPHRTYVEYLMKSREVHGVSPIFFPDYPGVFKEVDKKADIIELVVTKDILEVLSGHTLENYQNLELYVTDGNPQMAFAVTDIFFSIGFFYKSGGYDFTRDLISTTPSAIKFGVDLFNYYKSRARRVL